MLTISTSIFIFLGCLFISSSASASVFTVTNNCPFTIWPATLSGAGTTPLPTSGFQLNSGQSVQIPTTPKWSGRVWARTGCSFDASGVGKCETADCGGKMECGGMGATPPASLFEITIGGYDNLDYYDVSFVDGYNLPIVVVPRSTSGGCNATGCASDINMGCPKELQVVGGDGGGGVIACNSACGAFGIDQYCCSGQYANPNTCQPSYYSSIFKRACPRAYSYAFDDGTSTFTCNAYEYAIIFCPNNANNNNNGWEITRGNYGRNKETVVNLVSIPFDFQCRMEPPTAPGVGAGALAAPHIKKAKTRAFTHTNASSNAVLPLFTPTTSFIVLSFLITHLVHV
ncbi:hypothetical protein OSB04_025900 [Centaurea solstitialis]|uniref:Thaumatin-like protein n=1 Tax=Centaurea solstitialis TaxID=347529 RepID=A0AA38SPJ0_9ASTR|nr:hypothetical protein OSB04_025900 [Centaurea solstitialis]